MGTQQKHYWRLMLISGAVAALIAAPTVAQEASITVVVPDEPQSLDPCDTDLSNNSRVLAGNITETLTRLDPENGEVLPSLATQWSRIDENTWEFDLRENVQFHDGMPFNAAAVDAAMTRLQDDELSCNVATEDIVDNFYATEVIDDHTVRIVTDVPEPILPTKMISFDIGSPATPAKSRTRAPVGTGPYQLVEWNEGEYVDLVAFDAYWGEVPAIENVRLTWRAESAVRAAMVDTGEAQVAFEIAPQDATTENDLTYQNAESSLLRIDQDVAPLDDVRLREALNLAIDRDALIGTVFHQDVVKAMQPVLPSVLGFNPDIPQWPYDPERASELIAQARADGVHVDQEIVLYGRIGIWPNSGESMEAIQAMWTDVGFNIKLEMLETNPWLEHLLKPYDPNRRPNVLQTQMDNSQGDAVFTLPSRFTSDGIVSTLSDAQMDELVASASRSTGDQRRELFQAAFSFMAVDAINIVPLFDMVSSVRVSPDFDFVPDVQAGNQIKLSSMSYK